MSLSRQREETLDTDHQGYLVDHELWCVDFAQTTAEREGLVLTPVHWEVLYFLREFYLQYHTSPAMRLLVKAWRQRYGEEKGTSHYLYALFPGGPARQGSKIAGLPKPVKCL
jgi:tRNA 2-thiouridine synthesizing protein E